MREASPESVQQAVVEAANEWSSQRRRNCNSKQRPKKQGIDVTGRGGTERRMRRPTYAGYKGLFPSLLWGRRDTALGFAARGYVCSLRVALAFLGDDVRLGGDPRRWDVLGMERGSSRAEVTAGVPVCQNRRFGVTPSLGGESEYAMGADGIMRRRAEISQSSSRSGSRVVSKVVERVLHTDSGPDQQMDVDSSQARDKGVNGIAKQVDLPGEEVGRDDRLHVHLDRQGPLPSV
ncbi:hypothetical protein CMUS01_06691 [Colletotrichum musicola]|uniref:Uncharacterized protein n=1 Tax=Colletotrichum musicola TaxID=2175873 RepID=A0A8H6KK76_9PEZI|nr:hypothetical protein CMUS01_06691 [Colletotrichum musicola]